MISRAATLTAAGLVAFLGACTFGSTPSPSATASAPTGSQSPFPASPSASTSPAASTTVAPSPTTAANPDAGRRWARLPADPVFRNATVVGLTVIGSRIVATGSAVNQNPRSLDGAMWESLDGRSWKRTTQRPGFEDTTVTHLARKADGTFLALGLNCALESECAGVRTWTSPDGVRWTPVVSNFPVAASVTVIPGGPGWIAVGTESEPDGFAGAWTSANGWTWQRAAGIERVQVVIRGLVATRAGFVAYGSALTGPGTEPAVWTSRDGARWSRVPRQSAPTGLRGEALALKDGLLVAFARTGSGLEIWTSQDGTKWQLRPGASAPFALNGLRQIRIGTVINGGPGMIVFGSAETLSGLEPIGVWLSADGIRWQAAQDVTAFQNAEPVEAAAQMGTEVYAAGRLSCTTDPCVMQSTLWVSPPR
jgi:hypothetical protein